jgi:single-strand DNA-binding protein
MLNVVALNGRLTANPEFRHTNTDIPITSFTLAVDRSYARSGSERQADFIDIVCWRGIAEFAVKHFKKGQLVAVEGSIQTRTYKDNHGVKRKAFEVVANNVDFAEPKRQVNAPAPDQGAPAENNGDFVVIGGEDNLPV